jgi:ABC-type amino acid transport substrate-binding protein
MVFGLFIVWAENANAPNVYRVAVGDEYPPFSVLNREDNQIEGLSVDIMRAICKKMDAECEFARLDYHDAFEALKNGEIDIICYGSGLRMDISSMLLNTEKFLNSSSVFVGLRGAVKGINRDDLKGKRVGVVKKSLQDWYVGMNYQKDVIEHEYDNFQDIMTSLALEDIDLGFVDIMAFFYYIQGDKSMNFDIFGPPFNLGDGGFLMIRKNQTKLLDKLNKAILAVRYSSEFETINAKYFDFFIF